MSETYKVSRSVHGMACIELVGGDDVAHAFLRRSVVTQRMDDPAYVAKQSAGPYLQGQDDGSPKWTLVEFWQPAYLSFVE